MQTRVYGSEKMLLTNQKCSMKRPSKYMNYVCSNVCCIFASAVCLDMSEDIVFSCMDIRMDIEFCNVYFLVILTVRRIAWCILTLYFKNEN